MDGHPGGLEVDPLVPRAPDEPDATNGAVKEYDSADDAPQAAIVPPLPSTTEPDDGAVGEPGDDETGDTETDIGGSGGTQTGNDPVTSAEVESAPVEEGERSSPVEREAGPAPPGALAPVEPSYRSDTGPGPGASSEPAGDADPDQIVASTVSPETRSPEVDVLSAEPVPAPPAEESLSPPPTSPEVSDPGMGSETIAQGRPLPRAVAIANQKGGVGKTTTAVNLGAGLAEIGYRVLVVDLDPQGNATTGLGINPRNLTGSVYDVLMNDAPLEDCVEPTAVRNLFVVPATIDLAGAEIELVPTFSRELKLRRAIDRLAGDFDFTLIDCPPSLGLLTVNGLAAAGEVLVPIQCEYYALEGLGQLMKNIQLVQSNLNPRLELSTIVLTMYDARTRLSDQVAKDVREHFGAKVCRTIVPRTVRLSEAPSFGQPINVFDPSSRGATAYRELAKEVSGGTARRSG